MGRLTTWVNDVAIKPKPGSKPSPTIAVIEAIAEHEGLDPMDLEQPLHEVIDPDALDSVVGAGRTGRSPSDVAVGFSYSGYRVQVSSDGSVTVSPLPS